MKKSIKCLTHIFIILFLTNIVPVRANELLVNCKELTISNGLSNNTVRSIIKDDQGFLWFGTENGLNKFDGYSFKQYHHKNDQINTISDSFI